VIFFNKASRKKMKDLEKENISLANDLKLWTFTSHEKNKVLERDNNEIKILLYMAIKRKNVWKNLYLELVEEIPGLPSEEIKSSTNNPETPVDEKMVDKMKGIRVTPKTMDYI